MDHTDTQAAPRPAPSLIERGQQELRAMHKRRSYISSPETQQRIVRQFMLVLGIGVALGLANAYVLASFSQVEIDLLPEASATETTIALLYMASLAMASLGIVLLLAVFYSHRVGGPVFKIVAALDRIAGGDLRCRVRLRDTDLLGDVAQAVNDVGVSLGRPVRDIDNAVIALRDCSGLPPEAERHLADIEAALKRLGVVPRTAVGADAGADVLALPRSRQ